MLLKKKASPFLIFHVIRNFPLLPLVTQGPFIHPYLLISDKIAQRRQLISSHFCSEHVLMCRSLTAQKKKILSGCVGSYNSSIDSVYLLQAKHRGFSISSVFHLRNNDQGMWGVIVGLNLIQSIAVKPACQNDDPVPVIQHPLWHLKSDPWHKL